jgi:hypothetical protein
LSERRLKDVLGELEVMGYVSVRREEELLRRTKQVTPKTL